MLSSSFLGTEVMRVHGHKSNDLLARIQRKYMKGKPEGGPEGGGPAGLGPAGGGPGG